MSKFTDKQVVEALDRAVAAKGVDYVYKNVEADGHSGPTCVYALKDGSPSCIVGHVLADIAPDEFKRIAKWEREAGDTGIVTYLEDVATALFAPDQAEALTRAQTAQDDGNHWGFARDVAVAALAGVAR